MLKPISMAFALLCALAPVAAEAQSLPSPNVLTRPANDSANFAASTAFVATALASRLPLAGGTMTGNLGLSTFTLPNTTYSWASPPAGSTSLGRISTNNYPVTDEFGGGTVTLLNGFTSALDIPSNSTAYQATAISGYARGSASSTYPVGVYGQLAFTGNSSGGDAINGVCTNGTKQNATSGFSPGNIACVESDLNILPLAGGGAPSTNAWGFYVHGGSTIQPVGAFSAFFNNGAGSVPFKIAFESADGAATTGLVLNAQHAVNGTVGYDSQAIIMRARQQGTGTAIQGQIGVDKSGTLSLYNAAGGSSIVGYDASGTAIFAGNLSAFTVPNALNAGSITATQANALYAKLTPVTYGTLTSQRPCNSTNDGIVAYISDAPSGAATAYNFTVTAGGGTVRTKVLCNGTNYVTN